MPAQPKRKATAIIQARMGSRRLPGKVLRHIAGVPLLGIVVRRAMAATSLQQVIVATSTNAQDDAVVDFCKTHGISVVRGSETDVLDRYYNAAREFSSDPIARITADCPLIDPEGIDEAVGLFAEGNFDYVSNCSNSTYPEGMDVEVFSMQALEIAWSESRLPSEREHVTSYLRNSGKFRIGACRGRFHRDFSRIRLTVDQTEDLKLVEAIFRLADDDLMVRLPDILGILDRNPHLIALNQHVIANEGYYTSLFQQAKGGAAPPRPLEESKSWLARSQRVIPGCSQTLSKAYHQHVLGVSPIFFSHGQGCRVWDVDGNEYIDYVQGLLPNILGYAHPEVNAAVTAQLSRGHCFSLPHPLEVELAEKLTDLIPCAEMVRFARNGSDATSGAIRLARAFTGRDRVISCGYHGAQDWYIGSTSWISGVPVATRALTHPVAYNNLEQIASLFAQHPGEIAALIMEPVTFYPPGDGYLESLRRLTLENGSLLIFDEICTGFRLGLGGAQKLFGVTPDLACFGKAMANGFPLSCIVGKEEIMRNFDKVFFSFTFAGEVSSMAAALKTIEILERPDTFLTLESAGMQIQNAVNVFSSRSGLEGVVQCIGYPSWSLLNFKGSRGGDGLLERSLFVQELSKRGIFIMATHNLTTAHQSDAVARTLESYAEVFKTVSAWLSDARPERFLQGEQIQSIFKARN